MDKEKAKEEAVAKHLASFVVTPLHGGKDFAEGYDSGYTDGHAAALSASGGWVSVSERLPIREDTYIVTMAYGGVLEASYIWPSTWVLPAIGQVEGVIAWQEKPAPFTVEENKV